MNVFHDIEHVQLTIYFFDKNWGYIIFLQIFSGAEQKSPVVVYQMADLIYLSIV